jgi:hypothetical protein
MTQASALVDRDAAIWREWVETGDSMAVIGERYGLGRQAVSAAIQRYLASVPTPERAAYRERALARLEELYQAHREAARTSTRAGNLVLRVVLGQAHLLGLAPREVKVEHGGQVGHLVETREQVIADMLAARGMLPSSTTVERMDQGGDHAR